MDMRHMEYLERVAAGDVATLRQKETTYMGSWKRRGGVGAFMMLARKWDRLEIMMQDAKYDIFEAILQGGVVGVDGTAIAEVRDLRQYLTLVEAEMIARSVVGRTGVAPVVPERVRVLVSSAVLASERRVPKFSPSDITHPRTPEDGGQHASAAPWVVGTDFFLRKEIGPDMQSKFWSHRAKDIYVLEPYVNSFHAPKVLHAYYVMRGEGHWTLRIDRVPPDAREFFPNLSLEQNMMEHEALPEWQRPLYTWHETMTKFALSENNRAWHVEAE